MTHPIDERKAATAPSTPGPGAELRDRPVRELADRWQLISAWLLAEPGLTPMQIWERLLDEHDTDVCYTTVCHYRSTISSHTRRSFAFRAAMDDNARPKAP